MKIRTLVALGILSLVTSVSGAPQQADLKVAAKTDYDLVVVGGTPGGLACAVRAAQEGLRVLLVSPQEHLGGFMSNGCGGWEAPYDGVRSPFFDETRRRISAIYEKQFGKDSPQYLASLPDPKTRSRLGRPRVEPRVVEEVFEDLVAEQKTLSVLRGFQLTGAQREGATLESISIQKGSESASVRAKFFADCTYEGDLMAAAKVPFQLGREARTTYDETLGGVIFVRDRKGDETTAPRLFKGLRFVGVAGGVDILMPDSTGEADQSVMSYNFRLILTKNPANRVMVEKPAVYDPAKLGSGGRSIVTGLPNDKIAWNGGGRLVGPQSEYPAATYARRAEIAQSYLDAAVGRLWFYQNDPAAKPEDKEFWKDYGLAKDEFPDNGYLPYEIYVREGRRLKGKEVFTQHDAMVADGIERSPIKTDSVAVTDWPFDSTVCTPKRAQGAQDGIFQPADIWRPAQVPYKTMLPDGLDNLLVPVCLSASHVGWGTIRLEPVWMQTGEAAGFAFAQALKTKSALAGIDTDKLSRALVKSGFMVGYFDDLAPESHDPWNTAQINAKQDAALQYLSTKGFFSDYLAAADKPLLTGIADLWISGAKAIADQSLDAAKLARDVQAAKLAGGAPITCKDFAAKLSQSLKDPSGILKKPEWQTDAPATRGAASEAIYALLP